MSPLRVRLPAALTAVALASASAATAQTPAQRTVIEAFRDSLARAVDSTSLARLEAGLVGEVRRNRANTFAHLRLGFLALHQAELGRARSWEDAAAEFQWVVRVAPSWPYGWYGLGLAEFGLARLEAQAAGTGHHQVVFGKAASALARAVRADAQFVDLLVREAYEARQQRQLARAEVMLDALRRANQPQSTNPRLLAGLAALEREFGEPEAALQAYEAWVPVAGRMRGLAQLEVARTRFLLGRLDGVEPYFAGAIYDDSSTVRAYRGDLAPLATAEELQAFDAASGEARAALLRRFWTRRDAADLRVAGERLREHYRRLFHARQVFPRYAPERLPGIAAGPGAGPEDVDDRGLIYVRHGEPDDRVQFSTLGLEPNESWRYARPEGDLVLHFVARHEPDVYRLVESLMDVAEFAPAPAAGGRELVVQRQDAVLLSRETLSPVYSRTRRSTPDSLRQFLVAERALGRTSRVLATTTDSYRHRFARPMGAVADGAVFAAGPQGEGGTFHLAYAVPFESVGTAWLGQGIPHPLRLRLRVWNEEGDQPVALDSVVRPVSWASPVAGVWLAGLVSVPVPPGSWRVSAMLEDGEVGTVLPVREVVTPAGAGALWMSDLALGARTAPWVADLGSRERAVLHPAGPFPRQQELELVFEVLAPPDTRLQAQVTLMRTDDPAGVAWSQRREAVADGRALVRQSLDLRRLRPGQYRIEVVATDGRGGLSRRWREFAVR
jgi:GWxTD domain-containing protein